MVRMVCVCCHASACVVMHPSWLGLPLGAARAHDVVYGDVVVLRSPAAAGESLETTRVPVCERRLLNQKEVV